MKNFDTAARRGQAAMPNAVDITFQIDGVDYTAHPPTTGQIALFMGAQSEGGYTLVNAMFRFMDAVLDDEGVKALRAALQEGVELTLVSDIISYLIEEWSARPTTRSSGSSPTRKRTGAASTVRRAS